MNRNVALKILNPILAVLFANQMVTGIFRRHLSRSVFVILHVNGGLLFGIAVLLHLTLNWNWIKANYIKKRTIKKI